MQTTLAVLAVAIANLALGMQTDNHGIHAVPPPGRVAIDGKLDDWDLSGQSLICYDVASLKDVYSARVAMMYDKDACYVAIHWQDPTPMGNSHDPRFQANKGWAGDCVQLRLRTDRICHITAWYYAKTGEPCMHIDYGKSLNEPFGGGSKLLFRKEGWRGSPRAPGPKAGPSASGQPLAALDEGAEMAFAKDPNGRGYVQEIKLPWPLITESKRYEAGERFRCGIELLWGEADWPVHRYADNLADGATSREFFWTAKDAWGDVILEPKGKLSLPTPPWEKAIEGEKPEGSIEIAYRLPKDARVTLAIDDASGRRVRNLLAAAERKKGRNVDLWDGLDDQGSVVKPGVYTVKGLYHDGLHVKYATSFASPGRPGWQTADGRGAYYGDHTAPEAVAAGAGSPRARGPKAEPSASGQPLAAMLALACPMGEAGQHLIGVDMQGRRQWGLANRAAFGGGRISLATDGKTLWIANGDAAGESRGKFTIWRCELATGRYAPWDRKGPDGKSVLDLEITPNEGKANCRAIALHGGRLAVIVAKERRLLILDAEKGDILKQWNGMPEAMAACAFTADGKLLLATGDTLYEVDREAGKLAKRLDALDDPQGIACDADGSVYVSLAGQTHNVAVFDASWKKVREIGKRGGRPATGFFDANAMRNPRQIALDAQGRLWVTEATFQPKRTSVWSRDGGGSRRAPGPKAGPSASGQPLAALLFDLVGTTAYSAGGLINPFDHTRGFCEEVEYRIDAEKQTYRPLFALPDALGTGMAWIRKIVRVAGREYAEATSTARDASMVKLYVRQPDGGWRHCAEWGNVGLGKSPDDAHNRDWNRKFSGPLWEGRFGKAFLWIDRNDDGQAQRDEIETQDLQLGRYYWGQMMNDSLTVAQARAGSTEFLIFRPQGFTPGGTPLFGWSTVQPVKPEGTMAGEGMMAVGRDGRLYLNQSPLVALGTDGGGSPRAPGPKAGPSASGQPLAAVLWTYPSDYVSVHGSHRAPAAQPGLLIGPSSFYGTVRVGGEVGEVFYLNGNLGQNFIFTEDGLWVQSLFNDCRGWFDVPAEASPGMPCDAMTAGGESFGGGFSRSDDGKVYIVGGGTAAIVMELTGLDSLQRMGMKVTVTDKDIAAAQEIKVRRAARRMAPKVYTIRPVAKPLPTDGNLAPWEMDKNSIEIQVGTQRIGQIKAAYDAENLYLAYAVRDGSPLKNSGQDERLMFITGDCVDLMLRTDPTAKAPGPAKGDLRLLMTVRDGKPLAVLYEPVVPGARKEDRAAFSSPWRSVSMDRVRAVEFPLVATLVPGGYAVTAAVPLKLLGLDSLKGKTFRGDFGILGSDSGGRECTSRNYWCNKTTNNTNDVPDEAMLTPALWGELRFE